MKIVIKSEKQRIVLAPVYTPMRVDTDNEAMTAAEIEKMAYAFMESGHWEAIHTNHDGIKNGCRVVESFVARKGDPDFIEGEWVLGLRITNDQIWSKVLKGELNGFSWGTSKTPTYTPVIVQLLHPVEGIGTTKEASTEDMEEHMHGVKVQFDEFANVVPTYTEVVMNHAHLILKGTATEEAAAHSHRVQLEF